MKTLALVTLCVLFSLPAFAAAQIPLPPTPSPYGVNNNLPLPPTPYTPPEYRYNPVPNRRYFDNFGVYSPQRPASTAKPFDDYQLDQWYYRWPYYPYLYRTYYPYPYIR